MNTFENLKISQLDKKVSALSNFEVPKTGWIYLVRKTLGMTFAYLAKKYNTSPQVIKKLEQNEIDGSITLNTLHKIAGIMHCRFVYAFVPEGSFEKIIDDSIEKVSENMINRVSNTMSLESQLPGKNEIQRQKNELKNNLKMNYKKIWKYEI
ncbi:MAG: mobile mystery protein A [Ignavibacteria bacterium]|nr:mobile mystery protein A [Ignavibacteria bacterium]